MAQKRRGFRPRLSHAFFRWESAVTIALTIILMGLSLFNLPGFPGEWWHWLVLGVVAEALIIGTSLTGRKSPGETSRHEFDVRAVRDSKLREQVTKALEYQQRIEALAQHGEERVQKHLRDATAGVADWIDHILNVVRRLDTYKSDSAVQNQPELRNTMDRAELQLENTLAALGTVYVQLQLVGAGDSGPAQQVQKDIAGQIASLQDIIEAMNEVTWSE